MKRIKSYKVFESQNVESILDSVKECFLELTEGYEGVYYDEEEKCISVDLYWSLPSFEGKVESLDNVQREIKAASDVIDDIKIAVLRLRDLHPDLDITYFIHNDYIFVKVYLVKLERGEFYTRVGKNIHLDKSALRKILELDDDVNLSVWFDGRNNILRIDFLNRDHFNKHMYREFVDRREDLPSSFDNKGVEGALILEPELTTKKLGKNFQKLTIDGEPAITKLKRCEYSGSSETFYRNGVQQSKQSWFISLDLNKNFKWDI